MSTRSTDDTEDDTEAVIDMARRRVRAMVERDEPGLRALLHPRFRWTSHTGEILDLEQYLESNLDRLRWRDQQLAQVTVSVVADTAVLGCIVTDRVERNDRSTFRMPMTQTWVRVAGRWQQLAGHAGPLLDD